MSRKSEKGQLSESVRLDVRGEVGIRLTRVNSKVLSRDAPTLEEHAKVADDVGPGVEVGRRDVVLLKELVQAHSRAEGTIVLRDLGRGGSGGGELEARGVLMVERTQTHSEHALWCD